MAVTTTCNKQVQGCSIMTTNPSVPRSHPSRIRFWPKNPKRDLLFPWVRAFSKLWDPIFPATSESFCLPPRGDMQRQSFQSEEKDSKWRARHSQSLNRCKCSLIVGNKVGFPACSLRFAVCGSTILSKIAGFWVEVWGFGAWRFCWREGNKDHTTLRLCGRGILCSESPSLH